jgi:predicted Zn-ribbon and HTH transcriptional regulator
MLPPTKEFCLADKRNLTNLFALLMVDGAMCPKCGYGTRKTSKNWRRCKRPECGERIHMVPATEENVKVANAFIREAVDHA